MRLLDHARSWWRDGMAAVIVEVTGARGSVPRDAGTRMLVSATEALGTIGGGHLELKAIAEARDGLAGAWGAAGSRDLSFALGPSLGQCCGGAVTLRLWPLGEADLAAWPEAPPMFHLQLHGAGHVGREIARLLAPLPVKVDWFDAREDGFPDTLGEGPGWPAHIARHDQAPEAAVADAPPDAFFLVLTHRHDLDLRITEAILRRGDAAFLGLIGSRTKRQSFVHRLEERGLEPAAIARIVCPIGLPGITDKSPPVIAIAAVAQLLQEAAKRLSPDR